MAERAVEGRSRYKVYEDKIYRNSVIVKAAYNLRNNPDGLLPWQESTNRIMSDIRVEEEWLFGKIIGRNKFFGFGNTMKLQNSPVSKYYHLAVSIENAHTCMYDCLQTSDLNDEPPTLEEYFEQWELFRYCVFFIVICMTAYDDIEKYKRTRRYRKVWQHTTKSRSMTTHDDIEMHNSLITS